MIDETEYKIHYPPKNNYGDAYVDGGRRPDAIGDILIETQERVARVEAELESNNSQLCRIETKIDNVAETVDTVDENALDEKHFRNNWRGDIERNSTIIKFVVWGGSVALALLGMATTLIASAGMV